jgi:hypothetical protein
MEPWIRKFLDKNKELVGLADWKIFITAKDLSSGTLAEVAPEPLEKEMYLNLSKEFFNKTKKQQKNILLHELIHCRLTICKSEYEKIMEEREEFMVNDLARGMEKLL